MKRSQNYKFYAFVIFLFSIAMSFGALSYFALQTFTANMVDVVDRKSHAVGDSINQLVGKALDAGVPYGQLRGVDAHFESILAENDEIEYLVMTDTSGRVLYAAGRDGNVPGDPDADGGTIFGTLADFRDADMPVRWRGMPLGSLHLGVPKAFVEQKLKAILYDILTVIVVTLLLAYELVSFMLRYSVTNPLKMIQQVLALARDGHFNYRMHVAGGGTLGRFGIAYNRWVDKLNDVHDRFDQQADRTVTGGGSDCMPADCRFGPDENLPPANLQYFIRPALFLFIFAEAMSMPFLPMYAGELFDTSQHAVSFYAPLAGLSREIVIGLPISVFMFCWALSQPFAGAWSDRVGRRKAFALGAALTAVGLFFSGLARCPGDLILIRGLSGIGYGMVFITCTAYVTDYTTAKNRARGMAMFLSGFFSGSLCGAAIGGILVERIGFRAVLFLSTGLAIAAIVFVLTFLPRKRPVSEGIRRRVRLSDFGTLLKNARFLALVVCVAIPAKMALTGVMNYTAPLYLKQLGNNPATIGRVLMSYGLVMIFAAPIVGNLADRFGNRKRFIQVGGLLAGIGLMGAVAQPGTLGIWLSVCLLGLAHAISVSSQLAFLPELGWDKGLEKDQGTIMGVFRLIERVGSIVGPLLAGVLIAVLGFPHTFMSLGVLTIAGVVLFSLTLLVFRIPAKA